jgi:DivIVA domain-containing protein
VTPPRVSPPQFRLRWRGYDRVEVDEFLKRTAADRQRLQEDLAQLETILASRRSLRQPEPVPAPAVQAAAPALKLDRRRYLTVGAVSVVAFALTLLIMMLGSRYVLRGSTAPAATDDSPGAVTATASDVRTAAAPADGIVITLTARGTCWVRTTVDGQEPVERLLRTNDTILVRAKDETVLRVGDAAALAVLINGKPAKPLGAAGQVITTRITRTNYLNFLSGN